MAETGRLEELQRKFEENPRRFFAPLANEYRKSGNIERAIELCQEYLPQQPGHMSGYVVYGQALFDGGRHAEAGEAFQQALAVDPENIIALRRLGDIAKYAGEGDVAARWYKRVVDIDPKNEEVITYLANSSAGGVPSATHTPASSPVLQSVRPEPEPDPEAVALSELVEQPDVPQSVEASSDELFEPAAELPLITEFTISAQIFETSEPMAADPFATDPFAFDSQAHDESASEEGAPSSDSFGVPFATETMAELYLQQGFTAQALDVYRRIAATGGGSDVLEKIEHLEHAMMEQEGATAQHPSSPAMPLMTVRDFFAHIGTKRPPALDHVTPEHSTTSNGLGSLFGAAHIDADDAHAASVLAGAYSAAH